MDVTRWGPILVSLISAVTALYVAWQNRHKTRAEAHKLAEEAESEDVKQRGAEIGNLRAINDEWQRQYGFLVQRMDGLKAELDAEIKRRKGVEASSAQEIATLTQQVAVERDARLDAEKRAENQAQHLIALQEQVTVLEAENAELHTTIGKMQGTIESQNATISSLQQMVAEKDQQIASLRRDLSAMQVKRGAREVRSRAKGNGS